MTGLHRSIPLTPIVVLLALLVPAAEGTLWPAAASASATTAQGCGRGCPAFSVKMTFTQQRPWTYHHEQVSTDPSCVRTTAGHGSDDVRLHGSGSLTLPRRGLPFAGLSGVIGDHARTGVQTTTVAGEACAPTAVFPSTWRIISEVGGTVTAAEPTTGCRRQAIKVRFPTLKLVGDQLRLRWAGAGSAPEFKPCPFFDGATEAAEGQGLPDASYLDVTATVSLSALRNPARRRITASGVAKLAATETCANLQQPCPEGVSYDATGSVESKVKFVFARKRRP